MIDKLHNEQAELAVLSALVVNNDLIYELGLEVVDFYFSKHQEIYRTICELIDKKIKVDLITLSQELESKGKLQEVGGRVYVAKLTELYFGNHKNYEQIIKDFSIRRKLLETQEKNSKLILDTETEIEKVLSETQNNIFNVSTFKTQDDGIKKAIDELYEIRADYSQKYEQGKKYLGIETKFGKIDDITDGLRAGHLWIVGGWTSTGKTQLSLNFINSVISQNIPCSFYSLEMSKVDLTARLVGIRLNISSMKVLKGKFNPELFNLVEKNIDFLSRCPLEIHNIYDLEKIKMSIRRDVYKRGVKFVVLDYLQNIQSDKYTKEYDIITKAITDIFSLCQELQITIMVLSQVSNDAQKGQGAGAGFKGSGTIEAAADWAIRLKRDKTQEKDTDICVPIKMVLTKSRHGFTGTVEDYFMYLKSGLYHTSPTIIEGVEVFKGEQVNILDGIQF